MPSTDRDALRIGIYARFARAGVGRYVGELLRNLGEIDSDSSYFVFTSPVSAVDYVRGGWGKNLQEVCLKAPVNSLREQIELTRAISLHRLDLFHATSYVAPLLSRCPLVVTLHDMFLKERCYFPNFSPWKKLGAWSFYNGLNWYSVRQSRRIMTVSVYAKGEILHYYPWVAPKKISVNHNGVGNLFCPADAREIARVRTKYALPPFFFFYLGTVNRRKNLQGTIHAFELLRERPGWNHELVAVAAKDKRYPEVFTVYEQSPARKLVHWIDTIPTEDLPGIYSAATALVFPSFAESFGFPLVEAMACGTPAIVSSISCFEEIGGGAAIYVDPHRPEHIASACARVADNESLRRDMREKGLARATLYSWRKNAEHTVKIYREALAARAD